ncbi:MAG: universal stress protein [Gemmatimonadaceae bacterium]
MPQLAGLSPDTDGAPGILRPLDRLASPRALGERFPLLLAIANDETSDAAMRLTRALATEKGAVPSVVHALGDVRAAEASVSPLAGTVVEEYLGPDYVNECRVAFASQLASTVGKVEWPFDVTDELPIEAIVSRVRRQQTGLIVMGLRRHGVLRRVITRDLLAEVVRSARVPVLAVRPPLATLPRRVVVAVDFRAASIRAAHVARQLLANDGTLCLVHVTQDNSDAARAGLERILSDLGSTPDMTLTSVVLHGDAQSSIEGCAQAMDADLLAVGSEEHSLLDRVANGRMSMKLAHTARWSTLIVPARHGG